MLQVAKSIEHFYILVGQAAFDYFFFSPLVLYHSQGESSGLSYVAECIPAQQASLALHEVCAFVPHCLSNSLSSSILPLLALIHIQRSLAWLKACHRQASASATPGSWIEFA